MLGSLVTQGYANPNKLSFQQIAVSKQVTTVVSVGRDKQFHSTIILFWSNFLDLIRKASLWAPGPVLLTSVWAMSSTRGVFALQTPVGLKVKYMFTFPWSHLVLIIYWRVFQSWSKAQSCSGCLEVIAKTYNRKLEKQSVALHRTPLYYLPPPN